MSDWYYFIPYLFNESEDDDRDDADNFIPDLSNSFRYVQERIKSELTTYQKMSVYKLLIALENATIYDTD